METQEIIEIVQNIFIGADEHNWELIKESFTNTVWRDYSSMTGSEASFVPAEEIVHSWKEFLPCFKATHHQLGNFTIKTVFIDAQVSCYGTATHYLPDQPNGNIWTVVGTYNFKLVRQNTNWRVSEMRFNLKYQDGNLQLPSIATGKENNP